MTNYMVHIEFTRSRVTFPLFSWAVQLFERTRYSHVRISWRSNWFEWTTFEASGSSVKILGLLGNKNYPVTTVHRYTVKLNQDQYKRLIGMLRYAGVSYGLKQVFGIAIQRMFNLKRNPFGTRHYSMICSELVAYFLLEVLRLNVPVDLDSVGPRDIKKLLDAHPNIFKVD